MNDAVTSRPFISPHEVSTMAFLLLASVSLLVPHGGVPRSVESVLSGPMLMTWSIMLLVGSLLTLIGVFWRGRYITALGVERMGLIPHTAACLIYVISLVANFRSHNNTLIAAGFIAAVAVANIWKIIRISRSIRRILFLTRQIAEGEGE